ncbi:hypothetical protein [Haloferax mucosum]|uniref:hypothetical protein n=1 Tax=Haloferax mucosum TaxID=403181 RepID=UPI0003246E08|nr:hypothetical protein [Haloferax mucosum]
MADASLRRRLDIALLLLAANFVLLLVIGFQVDLEATFGVLVLVVLLGYGFLKGSVV